MKTLEDMAVEARRAYDREYYAKNKERIKAQHREYWKRKALKIQKEKESGNDDG